MSDKKDTNFTRKRELNLNPDHVASAENDQVFRQQQPHHMINDEYINQLEEQVESLKQLIHEQEQTIEEQQQMLEGFQKELEEQRKVAQENHENYLRARADVENTRRRARNEREQALKYAVVPLLETLLPVLDNFERALEAADESNDEAQTLKEGVEMVYRHFLQVLSEGGLTMIEAEGKPFDPHYHNAVMQVEDAEVESGIVVEELQSGYCYLDRVIRPTMVKVSK